MVRDLVLYGTGYPDGVKLIHAVNRVKKTWNVIGFLDDLEEKQGSHFMECPILGKGDRVQELKNQGTYFFNNVFSTTQARQQVGKRLIDASCSFATLIHPQVEMEHAQIGEGSILSEGVKLGSEVIIGRHCGLRINAIVNHNCHIEDFSFIGAGAIVGGYVHLEAGAYVGMGAIIKERVRIGRGSIVGAGAVVIRDVEPFTTVAGVPAKIISKRRDPNGISSSGTKE